MARHVDLAAVVTAAGSRVVAAPWDPARRRDPSADGVVVALAAGKAFSFGYPEHAELLRAAGADVVEFDPLTEPLPAHTAALVLPGGFPEQFTAELSANDVVRNRFDELAASGAPVHAECAGLTYLVDDLDGHPDVRRAVRVGALHRAADARLPRRRRDVRLSVHAAGTRVVGHEFHRTQ